MPKARSLRRPSASSSAWLSSASWSRAKAGEDIEGVPVGVFAGPFVIAIGSSPGG